MMTTSDRADALAQFEAQGFLVVEDVVPAELCARVRGAISAFTGVDEDAPETWTRHAAQGHGIVPLHHGQALWDVRQWPAVHAVFAALYGTDALWVSIDRVSVKAPAHLFSQGWSVDPVHWDGDPRVPGPRSLQGLVYLTDTPASQGAFCCVPSLYRTLAAWLAAHPDDAAIVRPDIAGHERVAVAAPAGSLVVWDRRMPHTSAANHGDRPRWVQYVAMQPAGDEAARQRLARLYHERRPPGWALRQAVPGQQDPEPGPPATLTPLGRRLAGVDAWHAP
ncbi:MAG: phytanoyl-CoA dioxygenase family protein [Gammaproteobacteria bacterium]